MSRDDKPTLAEPGVASDGVSAPGEPTHERLPRVNAARWWGIAILAYLLAMAVCTAMQALWPATGLLMALLAAALVRAILLKSRTEAGFLALNLALVAVVLWASGPEKAIGLTLAIAQAVVGMAFARSLRGPAPDLITTIACAIRPQRSARELAYTRGVCRAWATLMLALAALSLTFTFLASRELWWAWKLFGSWGIPVGFFALEWLYRQWALRGEPKSGWRHAWRAALHIDYPRLFNL